jgi:hypothetical protein
VIWRCDIEMDAYSKLYCKTENLLKVAVNDIKYFLKMSFRAK